MNRNELVLSGLGNGVLVERRHMEGGLGASTIVFVFAGELATG